MFSENEGTLSKACRISRATLKFGASFQVFLTLFFFPKAKWQYFVRANNAREFWQHQGRIFTISWNISVFI